MKVNVMAHDDNAEAYEKARAMTEKALDAYVNEDDKHGDKLIEQARTINQDAVEDVSNELEEDAGSEHDPAKLNEQIVKKSE